MSRRLLVLSPTPGRGGAEEYLLEVACAARSAGWEVTVAFEVRDATRTLADDVRARGLICRDAPIRGLRRWGWTGQLVASLALLLRVRPDAALLVVPWLNIGTGCIVAAGLAGVPALVVFQLAPQPLPAGRRWGPLARWARHRRQRWVAVSEQNARVIAQSFGVPAAAIETIPNGGPEPVELPAAGLAAARREVRAELGVPDGSALVLTVGRLEPQKGHADLLEALARAGNGLPPARFAWIGEGTLRDELSATIARHGLADRVRLLGHRADVPRLLDGADLFVLPSRFEGMPFALLEALAHGVPAITSDAGGSPEIVRDRVDGLVHRGEDPQDLARALAWGLGHPAEMRAMAASGRERARLFSRTRMLERTLAALEALADGQPREATSRHSSAN